MLPRKLATFPVARQLYGFTDTWQAALPSSAACLQDIEAQLVYLTNGVLRSILSALRSVPNSIRGFKRAAVPLQLGLTFSHELSPEDRQAVDGVMLRGMFDSAILLSDIRNA